MVNLPPPPPRPVSSQSYQVSDDPYVFKPPEFSSKGEQTTKIGKLKKFFFSSNKKTSKQTEVLNWQKHYGEQAAVTGGLVKYFCRR